MGVVALFAVVGLAFAVLAGAGIWTTHQKDTMAGKGALLAQEVYGGTATPIGAIVDRSETSMGQVVVSRHLVQLLASRDYDSQGAQLLVFGVLPIRTELNNRLQNGQLDPFELGRTMDFNQVVDVERGSWSVNAVWRKRVDGKWITEIDQAGVAAQSAQQSRPQASFLELSDTQPSFVVDTSGFLRYILLASGGFHTVLFHHRELDDLDDCVAYRAGEEYRELLKADKAAARASEVESAARAASAASAASDEDEDEPDFVPEYTCARQRASLQILKSITQGLRDIDLKMEAEGPDDQHRSKTYRLVFDNKSMRYAFGRYRTGALMDDPQIDFAATVSHAFSPGIRETEGTWVFDKAMVYEAMAPSPAPPPTASLVIKDGDIRLPGDCSAWLVQQRYEPGRLFQPLLIAGESEEAIGKVLSATFAFQLAGMTNYFTDAFPQECNTLGRDFLISGDRLIVVRDGKVFHGYSRRPASTAN